MGVNYSRYIECIDRANTHETLFNQFRRHIDYIWVVETVNKPNGLVCLNEVKKNTPELLEYLPKFCTSETQGGPELVYYDDYDIFISPTTCRYIKVLSDMIMRFGPLDGIDIVEVGGGYGGQCKIIHDVFKPKSYTIVDIHNVLKLAVKFTERFGIKLIKREVTDDSIVRYDLFISNYAFTEFDKPYQQFYDTHILQPSRMGYMICNFIGQRTEPAYSITDIIKLKADGKAFPEVPNSGKNIVYVWGTK
jgi:hypothetical protein